MKIDARVVVVGALALGACAAEVVETTPFSTIGFGEARQEADSSDTLVMLDFYTDW